MNFLGFDIQRRAEIPPMTEILPDRIPPLEEPVPHTHEGVLQQRADQLTTVQEDPNSPRNIPRFIDPTQTAAVVFGVGMYMMGFRLAVIDPPILSPWERAAVARDIMLRGEWVAQLLLDGLSWRALRASGHDIAGPADPRRWVYALTLPSPSSAMDRVILPAGAVLHCRINTAVASPWRGISPLEEMGISRALLACIEDGLATEERLARNIIVSHGPTNQNMTAFTRDLANPGTKVLDQSGAYNRPGATSRSLSVDRIGPDPPQAEIQLRSSVAQDVLSAMGIPGGLYTPREGSASREAFRQWGVALESWGEALRDELQEKLERPVTVSFHRVAAADIAARARGLKALVDATVEKSMAGEIAGFTGIEFEEPEPPPEMDGPPGMGSVGSPPGFTR